MTTDAKEERQNNISADQNTNVAAPQPNSIFSLSPLRSRADINLVDLVLELLCIPSYIYHELVTDKVKAVKAAGEA